MLTLFSFSVIACYAQKGLEDYFSEGIKATEESRHSQAVKAFDYIVKHHRSHELYPKSFYNLALAFRASGNNDSCETLLKQIFHTDFNEKESSGKGIMEDPFTNYRHNASILLSDILFEKGDFQGSLKYVALAENKYKYLHFCGNEFQAKDVSIAVKYARCYLKLKEDGLAIEKLLKVSFTNLADNEEALSLLRKLLKPSLYPNLKKKLDEAIAGLYTVEKQGYKTNYIKFLNMEIAGPILIDPSDDKEKIADAIRQSRLYVLISEIGN